MITRVPEGSYTVGDDGIPNAAPRHRRNVPNVVWVDVRPITWRHFEVFVAAGGYEREELWPDGCAGLQALAEHSVDGRVRRLLEYGSACSQRLPPPLASSISRPVTGVTWGEAVAICAFYGARLPFEIEWEVLMTAHDPNSTTLAPPDFLEAYHVLPRSPLGAVNMIGLLEEWTADAFSPRYYRADQNAIGLRGNVQVPLTVRGASPESIYRHPCFRVGREAAQTSPWCGFRRAWDVMPAADVIDPVWREQT